MEEHIEWLKNEHKLILRLGGENQRLLIEECIENAESMLEKEKEMMCAFAEYTRKCGYLSDQRGLMTTEELYDETFKTKE